jgi:hypothetical protein
MSTITTLVSVFTNSAMELATTPFGSHQSTRAGPKSTLATSFSTTARLSR